MISEIIEVVGLCGTLGAGGYVRNMFKTPFRPKVVSDETTGTLNVQIERRAFARFPAVARQHDLSYRFSRDDPYIRIAEINSRNEDADEQMLEAVVKAKNLAKEFKRDDKLRSLEKQAKKALKR